jgi:SAM-dependent methyltransferase
MENYDATTYGQQIAEVYDDWYDAYDEATISMLAELSNGGRVLEVGIGTGRVALPLAARGVSVHGIDASQAMVDRLRARPGGTDVPVTLGDFADVKADGSFSLVYVVFNTFFTLTTQADQVRCFHNIAERLTDSGVFVIEAFVPDMARFTRGQNTQASRVEVDHVLMELARHDSVNQRVIGQQILIRESGIRLYPVQIRYAWPAELDLMAQLAGLRLRHRWGGWRREAFTAASTQHVSIYERASRSIKGSK